MKNKRRVKKDRRLSPPRGRSATLAFYQSLDRRPGWGASLGVVLVFAAIAALFGFPLARVSWIWDVAIFAMCAATAWLLIRVPGRPDVVVVGADWMKVTNGRWVDTARLLIVEKYDTTDGTYLRLRDADGRHLEVRFAEVFCTRAVMEAFLAALQIARSRADVKIDPQIAHYLPPLSREAAGAGRPWFSPWAAIVKRVGSGN